MYYYITILQITSPKTENKIINSLKNSDFLNDNDLFVEIEYNKQIRRTVTKYNQKTPVWNETFLFFENPETIKFHIIDEDALTKNDVLETYDVILDLNKKYEKTQIGFIDFEYGYINDTTKENENLIYENNNLKKKFEIENKKNKKLKLNLKDSLQLVEHHKKKINKIKQFIINL